MLSEINIAPRILTNFTGVMPSQFKKDLDSYLKTRSPVTFLSELRSNLQVQDPISLIFASHGDEVTSLDFANVIETKKKCDFCVRYRCLMSQETGTTSS